MLKVYLCNSCEHFFYISSILIVISITDKLTTLCYQIVRWIKISKRGISDTKIFNSKNYCSSEQGTYAKAHSKKITTYQLLVNKLLVSRLYLLLERPPTHNHAKQKLQDKWLLLQLYHWRHCCCWLTSSQYQLSKQL